MGPVGRPDSAVDQWRVAGVWGDPDRRSAISSIQLDNSDVITFHSYAKPADFEARIDELSHFGRPVMCTEYLARSMGSTVEDILPIARRRGVGAYSWGSSRERPRLTCRGTPGSIPTHSLRGCGSAICSVPTASPTATMRPARSGS